MNNKRVEEGNGIAFIYKITCSLNGKYYVGSTVNSSKRKSGHFTGLIHRNHHCRPLQHAFNKYGIDNFIFSIVEEFEYQIKQDILCKEQTYLDNSDNKYNTYLTAGSPLGALMGKCSEEKRKKLSDATKGIPKSEAHKRKLSKAKLRGTSNDISVESIDSNGLIRKYRSICEASRLAKVGVQSIYDSFNKRQRKWRKKEPLMWRLATAS